jgi:hypothetical protein
MLRKSVLVKYGFRYRNIHAEDFDLWCRMALKCRVVRLNEVLLQYREHGPSAYHSNQIISDQQAQKSRIEYAKIISGIEPPEFYKDFSATKESGSNEIDWLLILRKGINKHFTLSDSEDEQIIKDIIRRYSLKYMNENNVLKEKHNKDEVIIADLNEQLIARTNDLETIKNSKTYKIADKMGIAYRKIRRIKT